MEADYRDETIQSFSQNILRLGNECRALADENKRLKHEAVHDAGQLGEQSAEIASLKSELTDCKAEADRLKSKIELLERQVNYWRIEAEVDHGRWQRCLEDLEHLRRLK